MKRSSPARQLLSAVLLVAVATSIGCSDTSPRERIVLIVVDTLRRDHLSPYGSELSTPTAQALADRGQVFSNFVASFHQTTMSMAALFTGLTPSMETADPRAPLRWTGRNWCGMRRFAVSPLEPCIPSNLTTLAESLQGAGWYTVGVVANALLFAPSGFERGFDVYAEVGAADTSNMRPADARAQRSAPFVREAVRGAIADLPEQPLFLYVHYVDVHDWTYVDMEYGEAVEQLDRELGLLMDDLETAGLLEGATVILTSDHGEALGERHAMKGSRTHLGNPSFQPVLEIPLIVAPAVWGDTDRMLRTQDLTALIEQLAGVPSQARVGPSQRGLADDELLLSEIRYMTFRRGKWKSMFHRKRPKAWALFDLEADPGETVNLLGQEPRIVEQHLKRIQELNASFATSTDADDQQTAEDRARLHALGYLADLAELEDEPDEAPEEIPTPPGIE